MRTASSQTCALPQDGTDLPGGDRVVRFGHEAPGMSSAPEGVAVTTGPSGRPRRAHHELAGAVADLGVLLPIVVALIVFNGLSATAVLLPAGLLYVAAGLYYRLPVPVQPLKAFGAIAIAAGLGADAIAAGALVMGAVFVVLGATGLVDRAARLFPTPLIRGVQLSVGLIFLRLAWTMVTRPPTAFTDHTRPAWWLVGGTLAVAVVAVLLRRRSVTLALVAVAVVVMAASWRGDGVALGPSPVDLPTLDAGVVWTAVVVLVLPQLPLTFANSCLATADVARTYFGEGARRVTPGRLAISLGLADLLAGAISGMPVCHGAGGMTAHRTFGARTGTAPVVLGSVLVLLALGLGAGLAAALTTFPLPILAGLLAVAGLMHLRLLADLRHPAHWALAIGVGVLGVVADLAVALLAGLAVWWVVRALRRRRPADRSPGTGRTPTVRR